MKTLYLFVVILLLSNVAFAQYRRSVRNLELIAEEKAERGDLDGAIADFTRAIDLITRLERTGNRFTNEITPSESGVRAVDPRAARSLIGRAKAFIAKRKIPEAWKDVESAIRIAPAEPTPYFVRASIKAGELNYKDALVDYERAIRLDPAEALYYTGRAFARLALGDFRGAMDDHDRAINMRPERAVLYAYRGDAKYELQDVRGALADYEEALRLDPKLSVAYRGRGAVMIRNGEITKAIDDLTKAIAQDANSPIALTLRGIAFYIRGDDRKAEADFRKAIALDPNRRNEIEQNRRQVNELRDANRGEEAPRRARPN